MTAMTLFDLAQSVRDAVNQIDPETGEIIENYAQSRELFQHKAVACVAYAKEEAVNLEAARSMLKQMQDKLGARERRLERFEQYMADCMKGAGITDIKHDSGLFSAKLYIERDASVEVFEEGLLPPDYLREIPAKYSPDKKLIGQALKEGHDVPGARIVKRDRLTIS